MCLLLLLFLKDMRENNKYEVEYEELVERQLLGMGWGGCARPYAETRSAHDYKPYEIRICLTTMYFSTFAC